MAQPIVKLDIMRDGKPIGCATVTAAEWDTINLVDYIEVDAFDRIVPEFVGAHGLNVACLMQQIVGICLGKAEVMR